jgi:hypothetical protein
MRMAIEGKAGALVSQSNFTLRREFAGAINWSSQGSCGNAGCADPSCVCSFCGLPIGRTDEELENLDHDAECDGCELCADQIPIILWRKRGRVTFQAQFHQACFTRLARIRSSAPAAAEN